MACCTSCQQSEPIPRTIDSGSLKSLRQIQQRPLGPCERGGVGCVRSMSRLIRHRLSIVYYKILRLFLIFGALQWPAEVS